MRFCTALLALSIVGPTVALAQDVALPGASFFPEGIDRTEDGRFYVSSFVTGDIETYLEGETTSSPFVSGVLSGAVGVYVDADIDTLWVCGTRADTGAVGLQGFDLDTGAEVAFHDFGAGAFCNDIAQDGRGNLYVTDSLGYRIVTIDADDRLVGNAASTWLADPAFALAPGEGTGLSVNGIAFHQNRLYVVNISRGELYRIVVKGNGAAGKLDTIALDRPLNGPDGIEVVDHRTAVVAENFTNSLSRIDITGPSGVVTVLDDTLGDSPTTFTLHDDTATVVIGQLDRLFGNPNPPVLPFVVSTVDLTGAL